MFESRSGNLPLLKHACGKSDWLLCWHYILAKVNLRECISHMPLQSLNKTAHSGFETQRRCHQKSKTRVSVAPQMAMCPTKFKKKRSNNLIEFFTMLVKLDELDKNIFQKFKRLDQDLNPHCLLSRQAL